MNKSKYKEHPMKRNAYLKQAVSFAQRMIEDGMAKYKAIRVASQDYNVDSVKLSMGIKRLGGSGATISESSKLKAKVEPRGGVAKSTDCKRCGSHQCVNLRMRLDSLNRPQWLYWCDKCLMCVLYNGKPFIGRVELEKWGIDPETIPQVK